MKPFNDTAEATLLLTEGGLINEVFVYEVDNVPTDISGGKFKWNILDKEGGAILGVITVSYTTDGTDGSITYVLSIADLATIIAAYDAGTTKKPGFHEFWFSSDNTDAGYKIWFNGCVDLARSGGS